MGVAVPRVRPQRMQPRSRAISAAHWAADARRRFRPGRGDEGAFAFDPEDHRAHRRARQQIKRTSAQGVPSTRVALSLVGRFSKSTRMDTADTRRGGCWAAAAFDMSVRASARGVGPGWWCRGCPGRVNDARVFGQDRPSTLVEHSGDRPIPFAPGRDRRRDRLARCWSR